MGGLFGGGGKKPPSKPASTTSTPAPAANSADKLATSGKPGGNMPFGRQKSVTDLATEQEGGTSLGG